MSEPTSHADDITPDTEAVTESAPASSVSRVPIQVSTGPAGWIAPVALVISLLAAVAAGWSLFKPASGGGANASAADPKGQVCTAFKTVSDAVYLRTNQAPPPDLGPATPAAVEAIAANARLAMAGGATYLMDKLPSNAPGDLAKEVRSFAGDLNSIAMNALAGISNDKPEQADLLKSAEEANKRIVDLCK